MTSGERYRPVRPQTSVCPILLTLAFTHAFASAHPRTPASVVQHNTTDLKRCYQRVLLHDPTVGRTKLDARLTIDAGGHVTTVILSGTGDSEELRACFAGAIKRWSFPFAPSDYHFEFPILLLADESATQLR